MTMMDLLRNRDAPSSTTLVATTTIALLGYGITQINWPRTIFRFVFQVVAPTKERLLPSDDTRLSPEARGLAWILLAGPPPPHDVKPIRTMMTYFWPHVWPSIPKDMKVQVVPVPRDDSQSLWITPPNHANSTNKQCLIHLHGGGMIAGTTGTERGFAVELSRRLQVPVLSVDYRLVPEYTVEEGVDDVVAAYQWLLKEHPSLTHISFLGGSAGAGHSLLAALKLKQLQVQPQPASLVLSSPAPGMEFLELTSADQELPIWKSLEENAPHDGYMAGRFYEYVVGIVYQNPANRTYFCRQLKPHHLGGLPPCLITAGSYEVILEGIHALTNVLKQAQVEVTYKEYWKMQHCHFAFFEMVPEASAALDEVIEWLQQSWKKE